MSFTSLRVSVLQLTSTADITHNLNHLDHYLDRAAAEQANLVVTPENTGLMVENFETLQKNAFDENNHQVVNRVAEKAKHLNLWVLIGSAPTRKANGKIANRSFLINPEGKVRAFYDKIHLFDVDLPNGDQYRESERIEGGHQAIVAQTPWGGLGLSICYDVRFPSLYMDLAKAGASMIAIPAAFTVPTGQAHWHTLVRARAIETGSFVFASGQVGDHGQHRSTFGHSLIVDPWGTILAEADGISPSILTVECDLSQSASVRNRIPNLKHIRSYNISDDLVS